MCCLILDLCRNLEDSYSRDLAAGNIDPKSGKKVNRFPLLVEVNKIVELVCMLHFSYVHLLGKIFV